MGRPDGAEDDLRVALREYRAIGEQWGSAIALTELAEFTELRGDHAASIAALEEAVSLGRELTAWGDLSYVEARLAIVRARTGELARAGADLDRVDAAAAARGGTVDIDRWVTFIRAELAWREGDLALAARCCADGLAALETYRAVWWEALRARLRARLALVVLAQGDESRCRDLLAAALDATAAWTEHSALADVLDACACYAIHRDQAEAAGAAEAADDDVGRASRIGRAAPRPAARRGARRPRRLRRVKPGRPAGPRRRPRRAGRGRLRRRLPVGRRPYLRGIPRPRPRSPLSGLTPPLFGEPPPRTIHRVTFAVISTA